MRSRNIFLAETLSSTARVKQIASIRKTITYLVNGAVDELPFDKALDPTIMVITQRVWKKIFTRWAGAYFIPTPEITKTVWDLTQGILKDAKDIERTFGGAIRTKGFIWGMLPDAKGVMARERVFVGGGGLFLEHACLCLALGMSLETAMSVTEEAAIKGGTTPLPQVRS